MTKYKIVEDSEEAQYAYWRGWNVGQELLLSMLIKQLKETKDMPEDLIQSVGTWLNAVHKQLKEIK